MKNYLAGMDSRPVVICYGTLVSLLAAGMLGMAWAQRHMSVLSKIEAADAEGKRFVAVLRVLHELIFRYMPWLLVFAVIFALAGYSRSRWPKPTKWIILTDTICMIIWFTAYVSSAMRDYVPALSGLTGMDQARSPFLLASILGTGIVLLLYPILLSVSCLREKTA